MSDPTLPDRPADGVTLRRGRVDDALGLRALGEVVLPATYAAFGQEYVDLGLHEWWSVERLGASLERIPHWVAEDADGHLVGVANLGTHVPEDPDGRDQGPQPTMWKLYVHPDHHGTGLAARLLGEVLDANGDRPLWLEVVAGNHRAEAFYDRHGFVVVRRVPEQAYPAVTLTWMRRDAP